jgi:DNA-binding CsgD family transcriptional regulator
LDRGPALIDLLYDGISDASPWSAFLEHACGRFGALACSLLFQDGVSIVPVASFRTGGAPGARARYWKRLYLIDPFTGLPPDVPITFARFAARAGRGGAPDDHFLTALDSPHILGVDVALSGGGHVRVRLIRAHDEPEFSDADIDEVAGLVPHMKRAFALHLRLVEAERRSASLQTLAALGGRATLRVDVDGRILSMDAHARAMLDGCRGLRIAGECLSARNPADQAVLRDALRIACHAPSTPSIVPVDRSEGQLPLALVIAPAGDAHPSMRPEAMLMIVDPDTAPLLGRDGIMRLLGLTQAEAGLVALLAHGLDLAEAAGVLGVRKTTVRAQLRAIFAKTGIGRQAELVRIVAGYAGAAPAETTAEGAGRSVTISGQ